MNTESIVPSLSVVPLIGINPDGSCGPFLGSASFVSDKNILITCNHVVEQWENGYGISVHEEPAHIYPAELIYSDAESDLACLRVHGYDVPYSFPLMDNDLILVNELVCGYEYGTTITAGNHINFSPASRLGNVTRILDKTDLFRIAGDQMLELSFPALKGASGAPVITWRPPFKLLGVISQNVARELHPAQVERIHGEDGEIAEETRFYLPQALAINVLHVRRALESVRQEYID